MNLTRERIRQVEVRGLLKLKMGSPSPDELGAELAAESGVGEDEFVARVSTESKVRPGETVELAFDTAKLVIFDADTGLRLGE